ncbi:hypothetical protein PVAND_004653 [Polypedilum vanderplanki]|uniref:BHLH domain-containing protein n=1 Tax=Polypedilum vanderplanki TaxID=319348 RepID=A0A9J6BYR7_POLVA|nr:hypothetical protein PVAND_004653 [Polypedilum vanderplanki]
MSTIQLLCKSENNMNNNNIFQASNHMKEIEQETIRLKREEGGGQQIIIQTMSQPQQIQQQQQTVAIDHDEKKMRRQIANSNERRRMQSINAGFQSLRILLPHHEGEKLSKAAILQQTAEYIDRLENEKQQLIATNQHLQRLVDSMGGGNNNNNDCPPQQQIVQQITSSPSTGTAIKKRKLDQVMTVQTISDSSDEGLGSMSPEPVPQIFNGNTTTTTQNNNNNIINANGTITKAHLISATSVTMINVKDYVNLQNQMETERRHRMQLEEQLKQLEMQVYSGQQQKYHHHQPATQQQQEIDEVDGHIANEEKIILHSGPEQQVHYISPVPHHSQFVVVSTSTPGSSPKHVTIVNDDDDNSRTLSSDELHKEDDVKLVLRTTKMSPKHHQLRMPSILEQAIKAEPKVEVERINSPCIMPIIEESIAVQSPALAQRITASPPAPSASVTIRTTYPNNSHQRPNLETIVEAIRHLEGDAFDMDEETATSSSKQLQQQQQQHLTQEVPLALTTKYQPQQQTSNGLVKEPFKFRQSATSQAGLPTFVSVPSQQQQQQQKINQQQQYQQRPGVIVVKQSS